MKKMLLQLLMVLLCVQSGWAQALHINESQLGHDSHSHAEVANHAEHAHEADAHEGSDCQQFHHHHTGCVALISAGQVSADLASAVPRCNFSQAKHLQSHPSEIDKPKWQPTIL